MNSIINIFKNYKFKKPKICIILGSGLSSFTNLIENKTIINYNDIPDFFKTTIIGHKGQFIFGELNKTPILCANGRFHYYEGYSFEEVSSIIDIFNNFNPNYCIITNSAGCLNLNWDIGTFMIANKFLDYSFINSTNEDYHEDIHSKALIPSILKIAKKNKINLYEGVYTYTQGPSYETPAEINEIIKLKGGAVGMSTFPEFLRCKYLNMKSITISCLTNYGAGLKLNNFVNHEDVIENAKKAKMNFQKLLSLIIQNIEH